MLNKSSLNARRDKPNTKENKGLKNTKKSQEISQKSTVSDLLSKSEGRRKGFCVLEEKVGIAKNRKHVFQAIKVRTL
jgi:hypothetical protein